MTIFFHIFSFVLTETIKQKLNDEEDRVGLGNDHSQIQTWSPLHNMLEHMPYPPGHGFDKTFFLTLIIAKLRNSRRGKGEWRLCYSPIHLTFLSLVLDTLCQDTSLKGIVHREIKNLWLFNHLHVF